MAKPTRDKRQLRWIALIALGAALVAVAPARAMADDPAPDKLGGFQTTPTVFKSGRHCFAI